ncbi:MAG: ABC transporter permease [Zestosphaera sp.]
MVLRNTLEGSLQLLRLLKNHRSGLAGLTIVIFFTLMAALADLVSPYSPISGSLSNALRPPSTENLLGTDELGRDLLSRLIHGSRVSLTIALISTSLGGGVGALLGLLSGYFGGAIDYAVMRVTDALLSIPSVLIAIALVALWGPSLQNIVLAISVGLIPSYVRLVRGVVLQVRNYEFVLAARLLGINPLKIIFRHVLPNISYVVVSQYTLDLGSSILFAAGLGFLGIGVQPPTPEWGSMIGSGKTYMVRAPHVIIFPGIFLFMLVAGFNLLGNALRDVLDPRSRVRYA